MSRQVTCISAVCVLRSLWKIGGFSPEQNGLRKQKAAVERWTPHWQNSFLCQVIVQENKRNSSQVRHYPALRCQKEDSFIYVYRTKTHIKMESCSWKAVHYLVCPHPPSLPPSMCTCEDPAGWKLSQGPDALCQHWDSREEAGLYSELHTHSQHRQRPGAGRGQPAPHKHRPPCPLYEPLVLLPGSGWARLRVS